MSDTLKKFPKGTTIKLRGVWQNEDATPVNLSGFSIEIAEAQPNELTKGSVSITDAPAGEFEISIPEMYSRRVVIGRMNWIRLSMRTSPNMVVTTLKIWVEIV